MIYLSIANIEDLKKKLREEAREKAEKIISRAKEEAEKIIKEAEKKWKEKAERERARAINEAKNQAQIIISEAKRKARITISSVKNDVLEELFNNVENMIKNRKGFDIKASLKNLLEEALQYIDKPAKIIINPVDKEAVKEILTEKSLNDVEIIESDNIIGGLIIESKDGKRVDNSYNTRLERARSVLAPLINKELWG